MDHWKVLPAELVGLKLIVRCKKSALVSQRRQSIKAASFYCTLEEECDISEVCITLRKRQYSISRHTDYDFDRTTDMPLEKFYRCQKVLHDPRHLSRPPTGFTNFLLKPYQRPVAKIIKVCPAILYKLLLGYAFFRILPCM